LVSQVRWCDDRLLVSAEREMVVTVLSSSIESRDAVEKLIAINPHNRTISKLWFTHISF